MASQERIAMGTVKKVLLVDDHPIVREGLRLKISQQPELEVCGEAEDTTRALALVSETRPDLVVLDLSLRNGHGLDLIKAIRERHPAVKVLVLTMFDEDLYAERALRAGATGYLVKHSACTELLNAIDRVLEGKTYFSPRATEKLLERTRGKIGAEPNGIESLSDRELEVFTLIGQGLRTGAIAQRLHLSPHTIDTYRHKIKEKLLLGDGAQLNRRAVLWVSESTQAPQTVHRQQP